jgi:predicted metallo-beta-lactamase superfamily hydrolase
MNKKLIYAAVAILVVVVVIYAYKNLIFSSDIEGKYVLVNYEKAFAFPSYPDTLVIEGDRFVSYRYGRGAIELKSGLIQTNIVFHTDRPSDVLGHTWVERKLNGEIRLIMNSDENVYYLKD